MNRIREDLSSIQKELTARQAKPIYLRVAAAVAYHQLTGRKREAMPAWDYFLAVGDTARALAHICDLYYLNDTNRLLRVPTEDVARGTFDNSGDILHMPGGTVYRRLSVRRADLLDAIAALKEAQAPIHASSRVSSVVPGET